VDLSKPGVRIVEEGFVREYDTLWTKDIKTTLKEGGATLMGRHVDAVNALKPAGSSSYASTKRLQFTHNHTGDPEVRIQMLWGGCGAAAPIARGYDLSNEKLRQSISTPIVHGYNMSAHTSVRSESSHHHHFRSRRFQLGPILSNIRRSRSYSFFGMSLSSLLPSIPFP
jgi:hypothetical protein